MNRLLKSGTPKITQTYSQHKGWAKGTDIVKAPSLADTITAHSAGTIIKVMTGQINGRNDAEGMGYGNYVMISHDDNYVTLYAHLKDVYVKKGQTVSKGQDIGYMGNTGNSFGTHLHFELRKYNTAANALSSSMLHSTALFTWLDPAPYINSDLPISNNSNIINNGGSSSNNSTANNNNIISDTNYSANTSPNRFKVKVNNVQKGAFTYYDKACRYADSIGGIVIDGSTGKQIYP